MKRRHLHTILTRLQEEIRREQEKPLTVAVMGQTGVGKSSLVNSLFGVNLEVDPTRPCTQEAQLVVSQGANGKELWFYDLPGLGEVGRDEHYLALYREKLLNVDIVLWALHADTQSSSFDREALYNLLSSFGASERAALMGKVTLVLTKADVVTPTPWILAITGTDECLFVPSQETRVLLEQKARYCWESILAPYKDQNPSRAPYKGHFSVPGFCSDGQTVLAPRMISASERDQLATQYPQYKSVFERLYTHHRVIPCSTRFRYNLDLLMLAVIDKIGYGVSFRLSNFMNEATLSRLSLNEALQYRNFEIPHKS